jgi:RNA-binding protein with serine-rich domain 1
LVAGLNRGKAAVEFSEASEAEKAVKHMNGGQLDGSFLTIQVSPSSLLWIKLMI